MTYRSHSLLSITSVGRTKTKKVRERNQDGTTKMKEATHARSSIYSQRKKARKVGNDICKHAKHFTISVEGIKTERQTFEQGNKRTKIKIQIAANKVDKTPDVVRVLRLWMDRKLDFKQHLNIRSLSFKRQIGSIV